jgi:hypothetical protein
MRVEAVPVRKPDGESDAHPGAGLITVDLPPDATSAVVKGLAEKTEYAVSVTAITSEYFDQLQDGHESKRRRTVPRDKPLPRSNWLPTSTVIAMTSGTDPPTNVRIVKEMPDSIRLAWTPARTYGSNRLLGAVVRWTENAATLQNAKAAGGNDMARYRSLQADCNSITIDGLDPGVSYRFIVEAVISVRMSADIDQLATASDNAEAEAANRRTTHVLSKPVVGRTRAPCEPPKPIVTRYTTNTIQLYWEKPLLEIVAGPTVRRHGTETRQTVPRGLPSRDQRAAAHEAVAGHAAVHAGQVSTGQDVHRRTGGDHVSGGDQEDTRPGNR